MFTWGIYVYCNDVDVRSPITHTLRSPSLSAPEKCYIIFLCALYTRYDRFATVHKKDPSNETFIRLSACCCCLQH